MVMALVVVVVGRVVLLCGRVTGSFGLGSANPNSMTLFDMFVKL